MIQSLKNKLYQNKVNELTQKHGQAKNAENRLKKILLFFDATDNVEYQLVRKYVDQLKASGSSVKLFAFLDDKKSNAEITIDHYTSKMINWYQVPVCESYLNNVANQKYDALITLLSQIDKHHAYIIKTANAKLKLGPYYDEQEVLFDINVDHKAQLGLPELIKNLKTSIRTLTHD